jgi:hypothetical protein
MKNKKVISILLQQIFVYVKLTFHVCLPRYMHVKACLSTHFSGLSGWINVCSAARTAAIANLASLAAWSGCSSIRFVHAMNLCYMCMCMELVCVCVCVCMAACCPDSGVYVSVQAILCHIHVCVCVWVYLHITTSKLWLLDSFRNTHTHTTCIHAHTSHMRVLFWRLLVPIVYTHACTRACIHTHRER